MGITAAYMVPHPPLIVPEIGRGEERKIQSTIEAYREVAGEVGTYKPETIVLLTPHQIMYSDYFHISPGESAEGDFGQFGASHVKINVSYDRAFADMLCEMAKSAGLPAGTLGEREKRLDHGSLVPLYFINQCYRAYRLVRIGLSGLPFHRHYELGQYIQETADRLNRKTVVIASGDLSHRLKEEGPYGYRAEGPDYDSRIMDVMGNGRFGELFGFSEDFCDRAGECGHRSFVIMAGTLDGRTVSARRLSYEGPFGVGYGICAFAAGDSDSDRRFGEQQQRQEREKIQKLREQEDAYVELARKTVETFVRTGRQIEVPGGLPGELYGQKAGVFVSIKENGRLRGCIGTIQATQDSIAQELICNAVSAAARDPRFDPIEAWELDDLVISVDVLGEAEKIDSPEELDVRRYGVIVTSGYRRGLLLPNLEGVDTVAEQVAIAKQKAGIGEEEPSQLERFEVVRHK